MSRIVVEAILTIASVLASTTFVAAILPQISLMDQSYRSAMISMKDRIGTQIEIIFSINSSSSTVKVWIKNIGATPIDVRQIPLANLFFGKVNEAQMIDYGDTPPCWNFSLTNGDDDNRWEPNETLEITIYLNYTLDSGDYYVLFVTYNGVRDDYIFSI
ncbi:hypothetical protein DRN89_03945 [archaeon]|nr:MAG: hypothetical protein DRN89_03945 [archaeon]